MPKKRPNGAKKETATADEVLRELTDIGLGRRAFAATDRQGNTVENTASVPERIRALELLAKYHKLTGASADLSAAQPVRIIDDIAERLARSNGAAACENGAEQSVQSSGVAKGGDTDE